MITRDLKTLHKVLKHIRRKYPKIEFILYLETKFFYYISVSDPYIFSNPKFIRRRDLVRRIHGRGLKKKILFITFGQYIKRK